jgi:hypothetical protein
MRANAVGRGVHIVKNKRFTTQLLWSSIFLFGLLGLGSWNSRFRFAEERRRVEKQQAVVLLNSLRWQLLKLATDVDEPRDWLERAEAIVETARPEGKVILLNPRFQQWTNWLECGDSQALVICQDSDAGVGRHASWFAIDFSRRVTVCEARD